VSRNLFNGYLANIRSDKLTEFHDYEKFGLVAKLSGAKKFSNLFVLINTTAQPQLITQKTPSRHTGMYDKSGLSG
jgi:hypothetical protein